MKVRVALLALLLLPFAASHSGGHHTPTELVEDWLVERRMATPEEIAAFVDEFTNRTAEPEARFDGFFSREDLASAGNLSGATRLLRFVQITDLQLVDDDAPPPMRIGLLDPVFAATISGGGERPQEEYSDEIMLSLVQVLNGVHAADPLEFAIHTGDNIDNALENELMRYLDLVEGTHTTTGPLSGLACEPDGQSTSTEDYMNDVVNSCTSLPTHVVPEVQDLAMPWYSLNGNHDSLIQGNVVPNPVFDLLASGFGRKFLMGSDYVNMHHPELDNCLPSDESSDFAHGFGFAPEEKRCDGDVENDAYYMFEKRGIVFVVLDTVHDEIYQSNTFTAGVLPTQSTTGTDVLAGLSEGAIDVAQFAWLEETLDANADKPVVLVAHHALGSFYNDYLDPLCTPVVCVNDVLDGSGFMGRTHITALIQDRPNILAWYGGHTHENRVTVQANHWNVETSGMLDLPQESRIVELWLTEDGSKIFWALEPIGHLFELAKELAATDPDRDNNAAGGQAKDRSVLLWLDVGEATYQPFMSPPAILSDYEFEISMELDDHYDEGDASIPVTVNATNSFGLPPLLEVELMIGNRTGGAATLVNGTNKVTFMLAAELEHGDTALTAIARYGIASINEATAEHTEAIEVHKHSDSSSTPGISLAILLGALAILVARRK